MNLIRRLIEWRVNAITVIAISGISSFLTVTISNIAYYSDGKEAADNIIPSVSLSTSAASPLDCADLVYSPIQKGCVEKQVFDQEMKTLFSALGLNTEIYRQTGNN